ncbi:hypothetical protein [Ruania albidiflava]|uniref:hypothetical protein n=1 Tax=Ruania albidiflava TaxID=366586 RepID=UPI0003B6B1BF|nr:hypothetical protein [Ruania albidiflava]
MSTSEAWPSRIVRLPEESPIWPVRAGRAHAVVLHGPSLGRPAALTGDLLEVLVDVERRGLHIVLVAVRPSDLDSSVAAICRHVLTADAQTLDLARSRWGAAQVIAVSDVGDTAVVAAVSGLPVPESRTLHRRLWERLRGRGNLLGRFRQFRVDTR